MTPDEEWRAVPGREGEYEVSSEGRVRSLDRQVHITNGRSRFSHGRVLRASLRKGYLRVRLGKGKDHPVHRLVMETFVGPRPDGMVILHGNGDPLDNRLANLRYGSISANVLDEVRHGTHHEARKTHCPKGHPYSPENTQVKKGKRYCRTCARVWIQAWAARNPRRKAS